MSLSSIRDMATTTLHNPKLYLFVLYRQGKKPYGKWEGPKHKFLDLHFSFLSVCEAVPAHTQCVLVIIFGNKKVHESVIKLILMSNNISSSSHSSKKTCSYLGMMLFSLQNKNNEPVLSCVSANEDSIAVFTLDCT